AEREREDRRRRETGALREHARAVPYVTPRRLEQAPATNLVGDVARFSDVAEARKRRAPRVVGLHPAPDVLLGRELDVEPELLVDVLDDCLAPEQAAQARGR